MNNAKTYTKGNAMQKRDAEEILRENTGILCCKDGELIIDIGCGAGDVTNTILMKKLPTNIGRVIGSDLSSAMVTHATATHIHPKLSFMQLDIAARKLDKKKIYHHVGQVKDMKQGGGVFDKLFSFYCLHWVMDQKRAIRNMHSLIKTNGEGLVLFLANCPVFALYERLAQKSKWKPFMKGGRLLAKVIHERWKEEWGSRRKWKEKGGGKKTLTSKTFLHCLRPFFVWILSRFLFGRDVLSGRLYQNQDVSQFVSPYQHSSDPRKEFNALLEEEGFEVISCSTKERRFPFGSEPHLKEAIQAVNPFVDRIPESLKGKYLDDCVRETKRMKLVDFCEDTNNNEGTKMMEVKYELLEAHFKKR